MFEIELRFRINGREVQCDAFIDALVVGYFDVRGRVMSFQPYFLAKART